MELMPEEYLQRLARALSDAHVMLLCFQNKYPEIQKASTQRAIDQLGVAIDEAEAKNYLKFED